MNKRLVNVVALGSRDYYKVAVALYKNGQLGKLITDFYCPNVLRKIIKKRHSLELPSGDTLSLWPFVLVASLLSRVIATGSAQRNLRVDFCFGYISALITFFGRRDAIVYSYYGRGFAYFLNHFKIKTVKYIIFQVHPTPWFVSNILSEDQQRHRASCGGFFREEQDVKWSLEENTEYFEVLKRAAGVICASSTTKNSLSFNGESITDVGIIPYGSKLSDSFRHRPVSGTLKLLTVSNVSQRKGLHYAFQALKNAVDIDWVVIGNDPDPEIVKMAPSFVRFIDRVSDEALKDHFTECHMFVMPSLVEGFGLVYLEAISQGAVVLCSDFTGVSDSLVDFQSGLIVRAGDCEDILYRIEWAKGHLSSLESLANNARSACKEMNWRNFEKKLVLYVQSKFSH